MDVMPLKYGAVFKHTFSQPEIFCRFASDVLDIDIKVDEVHTEYEYPEPIGFVRSKYDLFAEDTEKRIIVEIQQVKEPDFYDRFLYYHLISMVEQVGGFKEYGFDRTVYTIVVLTSTPRDDSVNFSCAVSDMNPIDEFGLTVEVYPHRLVFLCPRQVNAKTPAKIKKWLEFIEDSLDGRMEEDHYQGQDALWQKIMQMIYKKQINPDLLSKIKDEAAWDKAKKQFTNDGVEKGIIKQQRKTVLQARKMGLDEAAIAELTGLSEKMLSTIKTDSPKNL